MFISIPKSFFVPVLFSDKFELNLENNNMEYDTEKDDSRSIMNDMVEKYNLEQLEKDEVTEESEEKAKVLNELKLDKENENNILDEADEEFIHSKEAGR